jgi:hypothetical protein
MPSGLNYLRPQHVQEPHFMPRSRIYNPHPHSEPLRMQNVAPRLSATPSAIRTPRRNRTAQRTVYRDLFWNDAAALAATRHVRR